MMLTISSCSERDIYFVITTCTAHYRTRSAPRTWTASRATMTRTPSTGQQTFSSNTTSALILWKDSRERQLFCADRMTSFSETTSFSTAFHPVWVTLTDMGQSWFMTFQMSLLPTPHSTTSNMVRSGTPPHGG